jgi:hypothetical protein
MVFSGFIAFAEDNFRRGLVGATVVSGKACLGRQMRFPGPVFVVIFERGETIF